MHIVVIYMNLTWCLIDLVEPVVGLNMLGVLAKIGIYMSFVHV